MPSCAAVDLRKMNIAGFVESLRTGRLDLGDFYRDLCAFIREKDKELCAFRFFDEKIVEERVHQLEKRLARSGPSGLLFGVPVAVKDVFNTVQWGTEMGSAYWKGHVAGNNARVIDRILWEDGVLTGKTITAELAVHHPGPTKNPRNPDYSPGTSSMGSAVAVAGGMSLVALGTQTGASITRPASYCGVFGFKPSYGVLPRTGVLKTTDTLDHIGYFANHIEDVILLFDILRVSGENYPLSHEAFSRLSACPAKARIGILRPDYLWRNYQGYVKESFESLVDGLRRKADLEVVDVRDGGFFDSSHEIHSTLYDKSLSYYFREESANKDVISSTLYEMVEHGRKISAIEFHEALNAQSELREAFERNYAEYDVIFTPATANIAPKRNAYREVDDTGLVWSLLGAPALSIPAFQGPDKMPFGLLAAGRRYSDLKLMAIVRRLLENHEIQLCAG